MKNLAITTLAIAFLIILSAFHSHTNKGEVVLTCSVTACNKVDSLYLFEFNGVNFKKIKSAPTTDWQTYRFRLPATGPRFYYVGPEAGNLKPLILGTEEKLTLNGSCQQFQGAQLPDSDLNKGYEALKPRMDNHKNQFSQLLRQLQSFDQQGNVEGYNQTVLKLRDLDNKRLHLLDSLKKTSPYLAKILALNTYLSYHNHGTADQTEIEYFANQSFRFVDWKDPDYNYNAWVFESLKGYAQTLASINLPETLQKQFIDNTLAQIPASARTYMLALGGVIAGLQAAKSPILGQYASQYIEKYRKTEPEATAQVEQIMLMSASFITGTQAPDFTMNDPDGNPRKLSEFRGKILLVDFWASWCGPCRRENPHVVELYKKYHSKGFDVLGVSLDKTREAWLKAIETDGLTWNHVSDLKGWANDAAKLYGVTSIPHTVLLDKNGKIIARNLRGHTLEAKLKEIFGF